MLFFCRWSSSVASQPRICLTLRQVVSYAATWSCCPCSSWFSPGWSAGSSILVSVPWWPMSESAIVAHAFPQTYRGFKHFFTSCWSYSFYSRCGGMCGTRRMSKTLWGQCGLHQHCLSQTGGGSYAQWWVAKDHCLMSQNASDAPFSSNNLPLILFYLFQVCEVLCSLSCWPLWWAHLPPFSTVPVLSSQWTSTLRFAAQPVRGNSWLPAGKTHLGFNLMRFRMLRIHCNYLQLCVSDRV